MYYILYFQYRAITAIFNCWRRCYFKVLAKSWIKWKDTIHLLRYHETIFFEAEKQKKLITLSLYNVF